MLSAVAGGARGLRGADRAACNAPMAARTGISAFLVVMNEEEKLEKCLASLAWCDEIIVVDSGSTDSTLDIARRHGCRVEEREWQGFVRQKTLGLSLCRQPWVLNLDADEEVSPELKAQIVEVLERDSAGGVRQDGFELLRVVFYLGRWWRRGGWYPEWRLRLARRDKVTWHGEEPHEHAEVPGRCGRLTGELRHYTYRDVSDHVRRINTYSSAAARAMFARGRRASWPDLLLRPKARFFKFYIVRRGYREGRAGFLVAALEAWGVFLKYLKLRELERGGGR